MEKNNFYKKRDCAMEMVGDLKTGATSYGVPTLNFFVSQKSFSHPRASLGSGEQLGNALNFMKLLFVFGMFIFMMSFGLAVSNPSSNWQSHQPTFEKLYSGDYENYWPILKNMEEGDCEATTDFIVGIPPGGCSPSVVTSDLLAEQNVPVFCQLYVIKINPLIKVSSIKSISFKGDYPEGVRSVVFHPARAAVKSYSTLLGSPTLENIGYVVIILERNKVEKNMEEWVAGNLTATMKYDAEEAYGTGKGDYYLEPMGEEEKWEENYLQNSFWNGRGYLRVLDVGEGTAKIQVMEDKDKVLRTLNLKVGETSSSSFLPGFYCKAGMKVKLSGVVTQEDMALLNVDGQNIWVREGSKFLDGKCYVSSLNVRANNDGEVNVRCSGAGTINPLILRSGVVQLRDGDETKEYRVGDSYNKKNIVAFGKLANDEMFVVLNSLMPGSDELAEVVDLSVTAKDIDAFIPAVRKLKGLDNAEILSGGKVVGMGVEPGNAGRVNEYFSKSVDVVKNELVEYYGSEKKETGEVWAEQELYEEIELARRVGEIETQKELMDLFLKKYPLAKTAPYVKDMRAKLEGADYSESYANVFIGDEFKSISVVDFKMVGEGEKTVDLRVGVKSYDGRVEMKGEFNGSKNGVDLNEVGRIEISKILPGEVKVYFRGGENVKSESATIKEGERKSFAGIEVYVKNVNVKQVAHVEVIPDIEHDKSEANFTFRIGIEQRAIELAPEKAVKMIRNLDKSIEKWEGIVDRLETVVTGLKGTCLATSAVLMIKNMAMGVSGEAAARTKVMAKYKELCDTEYKDKYATHTECYNALSGEIDNDVAAMTAVLSGVNSKMEMIQDKNTVSSGGLLGGKAIENQTKYLEELKAEIKTDMIETSVGDVPKSELYSVSQVRAVLTWEEAVRSGKESVIASAKSDMDNALRNVALAWKSEEANRNMQAEYEKKGIVGAKFQSYVSKDTVSRAWDRQTEGLGEDEKKIQYWNRNGKAYKLILDGVSGGNLGVVEVKVYDGNNWVPADESVARQIKKEVVFADVATGKSCSNSWQQGNAKVSYYESGNNKGLPAIVPFDTRDGWYAMVPNSGGTFIDDSPQGYTMSADVKYFHICNIGEDGIMKTGDDDCQGFSADTVGTVGSSFGSCMSESETRKLYDKAREAIKEAAQQYGKKSVNILGESMDTGEPMSAVGGFECQDFMSPQDCKIMFNVCDPVICPPSRCNLGGKWPVKDVIQSGIIGSLVLCLPNAKEGVLMPICLSGVYAGFDAYVSILKSERDCLQKSIETGELVGICDQITSVYKCEFFWRQLSPLMDKLVPSLIEYAVGGGRVRGGGEYALASQSWNAMKQGMDYFKNTYAQNAFKAFNIRSTQEIGSTVCKAFVGTSFPSGANFIEDFSKPESPSQFYAQFSENLFTEATTPSTSQYKVYYHIYAGKDQGVQYKVYLKNPPVSSYYASNPEVSVKSGYIAKGTSADESIDFTAPSGYKELCVVINAQEECGFKQVSSSFGVDFIGKKYTEEQAEKEDIKSEKECVSGSPSALSFAQLDLQAGAEEAVNPNIAMRGIVRVCATSNPDGGTTASSRWKDVGYCGDSSMRCWLDVDSVKDDLQAIEKISGEPSKALDSKRDLIEKGGLDLEGVRAVLSKAWEDVKELSTSKTKEEDANNITKELDRVIGTADAAGAGTNVDRAEALALKASIYRLLTEVSDKGAGPVVAPRADVFKEDADVAEGESVVFQGDVVFGYSSGEYESTKGNVISSKEGSYVSYVHDAAENSNVNYNLVRAVIMAESAWNRGATSKADAYGLMQLVQKNAAVEDIVEGGCKNLCGGTYSSNWKNNAETNVKMGTCYLACLRDVYGFTDVKLALAAYNYGPSVVDAKCKSKSFDECKSDLPQETQDYVPRVLGFYARYSEGKDEGVEEVVEGVDVEDILQRVSDDEIEVGKAFSSEELRGAEFVYVDPVWKVKIGMDFYEVFVSEESMLVIGVPGEGRRYVKMEGFFSDDYVVLESDKAGMGKVYFENLDGLLE